MGEKRIDRCMSFISKWYGIALKWFLIVSGLMVAIEQIMMHTSLNKLIIATLIAVAVGVVAIECLVRKKF